MDVDPKYKRGGEKGGNGHGHVGAGAPGGPLIMSGYKSPLISVSGFRSSSLNLLAALQSQLLNSCIQIPDDDESDLLVEDLKILTDAQLVELALEEALQPKGGGYGHGDGGDSASLEVVPYDPESLANHQVEVFRGRNEGSLQGVDASGLGFYSPLCGRNEESMGSMDALGLGSQSQVCEPSSRISSGENEPQHSSGLEVMRLPCADLSIDEMLQADGGSTEKEAQKRVSENEPIHLPNVQPEERPLKETENCGKAALEADDVGKDKEINEVDAEGPQTDPPSMSELQQKRKRGRPYDVFARGPALEVDARKEAAVARFKQQRKAAKKNCSLHSLRAKKENEGINTSLGKIQNLRALKFFTSFLQAPKATTSRKKGKVINPSEVILCIEFYGNMKKKTVTQELLVLGSQPLTALRDQLYCLTDELAQRAGVKVPSGYFLIEDIFYNDMRDSMSTNYSTSILNWVNQEGEAKQKWKSLGASALRKRQRVGLASSDLESREKFPVFKQADMHRTCFLDLQCRLGADYLYCHQGDCKHIFVIRDLRMVHPADVQNVTAYPLLRFPPALKHRKCSICSIYRAKKVTLEDKLAPDSPSFFCENCYYLLHYSKDGSLLYDDFKVYDYFHE